MPQKMALRISKKVAALGGSFDYVKSDRVPPGEVWALQGQAYENQTGARGTFRRYIERPADNLFLGEQTSPGSGTLYTTDNQVFLVEGECLVLRQASATANDVLALYAHGFKIFLDPGQEG